MSRSLPLSMFALLSTSVGCAPDTNVQPVGVIDLSAARGLRGGFVGVTVEPDTGKRYVLHESAGIYELDEKGLGQLLVSQEELRQRADVPPNTQFTDLAAIGEGRFGLIAANDGYLYDHRFGELSLHFCYEPLLDPSDPGALPPGPDPVPVAPS
ncbi:MAG: hypothetical protein ACO3JL_20500, partial [Myxococcota bacterium]